jgi:hypothetical protein
MNRTVLGAVCFENLTGEFRFKAHYMGLTPHCGAIVRKLPGLDPGVDGER